MNLLMLCSRLVLKSNTLIYESQKERGITSLFLGSDGNKFSAELSDQYKRTDLSIEDLGKYIGRDEFREALDAARNQWQLINKHREEVNGQSLSDMEGIEFYTHLNELVLELIDRITKQSYFNAVGRESSAYINFLQGKEYSGLERALVSRALSKGSFEMGGFRRFSAVINAQQSYFEVFRSLANPEQIDLFDQMMASPIADEVRRIRQLAFKSGEVSILALGVDVNQWFSAMTEKINLMQEIEGRLAREILILVQTRDPEFTELHQSAISISALVHELQKERGYTAGYLGGKGRIFKNELSDQRALTDNIKYELERSFDATKRLGLSQNLTRSIESVESKISEIDGYRSKIDMSRIGALKAIQFYTDLNSLLLDIVSSISQRATGVTIRSQYFGYISFMRGKERAGVERAILSRVFAADQLQDGALLWLGSMVGSQESYFESFRMIATPEQIAFFDRKMANPVVDEVRRMRELVFDRGVVRTRIQGVDALDWYNAATQRIDLMRALENRLSDDLSGKASALKTNALTLLTLLTLTVLLVVSGVVIAIYFITRSIKGPIEELIQGAEIIGEGNLAYRVRVNAQDEFARLASAFNLMAAKREVAEREITEAEERYRDLVNCSPDLVWRMTPAGVFTFLSPSLKAMSGYEPHELVGLSFEESTVKLFTDESRQEARETLNRRQQGEYGSEPIFFELTHRRKDGTEYTGEVRSAPILGKDGEIVAIQGITRDITDRKRAAQAIKEAEERFHRLADAGDDAIFITSNGVILEANDQALRMYGFDRDTLVGSEEIKFVAPHSRDFVANQIANHDLDCYESEGLKNDGSTFPVEVFVKSTSYQGNAAWIVVVRDITEKKLAETKNAELQTQLQQTQKMEAIGTLAGGIAHDFNNILAGVYGFAELAQQQVPAESPALDSLEEIVNAVDRAKNLTQQILTFSRKSEQHKVPVDLRSIIRDALKFLRPTLPTTIEVREKINTTTGWIHADANQMHQLLINLSTNAAAAMQERGGVLELVLAEMQVEENDSVWSALGLSPGNYSKLTVRDTGAGISSAVRDRIFDPFFTTKEVGDGTGLGLAIVHAIVTDHDGIITVDSSPGEWTSFTILLPQIEASGTVRESVSRLAKRGAERILYVDDEENITRAHAQLLEELGYEVVATNSSLHALEIFRAQTGDFDLLITDQTMPDMTGEELVREILALRAETPIILCTGFSEKIDEDSALALGIHSYLQKPVSINTLSETIRSIFDRE